MNTRSDKNALRDFLASKVDEALQENPETLKLYASQPIPDTKPYTKRETLSEKAFKRDLEMMREENDARNSAPPVAKDKNASLALDDYPGLTR